MEKISNLNVTTAPGEIIEFLPDCMDLELDSSLVSKETTVTFSIRDTRPPAEYLISAFREIKGKAVLPNATAESIYNRDGTLNYPVLNAVLLAFGVQAIEPTEETNNDESLNRR